MPRHGKVRARTIENPLLYNLGLHVYPRANSTDYDGQMRMLAEFKSLGIGVVRFSHSLVGKFATPVSSPVITSLLTDLGGAVDADVDITLTCECKTDSGWIDYPGYGDWTGVNFTDAYCFRPPAGPADITWLRIGSCWAEVITLVIAYLEGRGYDWETRLVVEMPNEMREYDPGTDAIFSRPTYHRTTSAMSLGATVLPCVGRTSAHINGWLATPYNSTHVVIHTGNGTRQILEIASVADNAITLETGTTSEVLSGAMFSFVRLDEYGAVTMFDEAARDMAGYMAQAIRTAFPTLRISTGTMNDGFPCRDSYTGLGYDFIVDRVEAYKTWHLNDHPLGTCINEAHFNPYPRYDDSSYTTRWATIELYEEAYIDYLERLVNQWRSYAPFADYPCAVSEFGWTSEYCANDYGTIRPGGAGARDEFYRGWLTGRLAKKIQDAAILDRAIIYNSVNGSILEFAFQSAGQPLESLVGAKNGLQRTSARTEAPPMDNVYGGQYAVGTTTYRTITAGELP